MEKLISFTFAFTGLLLFLNGLFPIISYCDAAEPWDIFFQENASPISEGIVDFHDHLSYYLLLILVIVSWMLAALIASSLKKKTSGTPFITENKNSSFSLHKLNENGRATKISLKDLNHGSVIEIVWTITPAIILVLIAFPSFRLLYLMDEIVEPLMTVKAIGRQWYWIYEYTDTLESGATAGKEDSLDITFESYMKATDSLDKGELRLLETDNKVVLPLDTRIRIIATGADVIHSWAVPSLGVKIDAIPGRLNQVSLDINREGTFYGQCSELCGVNHGFMPIQVEVVPLEAYVSWLLENNS